MLCFIGVDFKYDLATVNGTLVSFTMLPMVGHVLLVCKRSSTVLTVEWFRSSVDVHVSLEVIFCSYLLPTDRTLEPSFAGVDR